FSRQADGRYRSKSLLPDIEYMILALSKDYVPRTVRRLTLPEGGFAELTLRLRRRPKPPEIGKPAPAFSVKTIDGDTLNLEKLRSRFVLLHFWSPVRLGTGLDDVPYLNAVADRFEKDDRLLMVGLCAVDDPEVGTALIKDSGLPLVQVVLR